MHKVSTNFDKLSRLSNLWEVQLEDSEWMFWELMIYLIYSVFSVNSQSSLYVFFPPSE